MIVNDDKTIKINVLFFGAAADAAGQKCIELETLQLSSRQILDRVRAVCPKLTSLPLLYAINQEYATGDELVHAGDEFAVFTPVSGG